MKHYYQLHSANSAFEVSFEVQEYKPNIFLSISRKQEGKFWKDSKSFKLSFSELCNFRHALNLVFLNDKEGYMSFCKNAYNKDSFQLHHKVSRAELKWQGSNTYFNLSSTDKDSQLYGFPIGYADMLSLIEYLDHLKGLFKINSVFNFQAIPDQPEDNHQDLTNQTYPKYEKKAVNTVARNNNTPKEKVTYNNNKTDNDLMEQSMAESSPIDKPVNKYAKFAEFIRSGDIVKVCDKLTQCNDSAFKNETVAKGVIDRIFDTSRNQTEFELMKASLKEFAFYDTDRVQDALKRGDKALENERTLNQQNPYNK